METRQPRLPRLQTMRADRAEPTVLLPRQVDVCLNHDFVSKPCPASSVGGIGASARIAVGLECGIAMVGNALNAIGEGCK